MTATDAVTATEMTTPIADFLRDYAKASGVRLHMPGHKGVSFLGCEPYDLTEIRGADVLSEAEGIIGESERNASALFETAHTLYSTEGSTLAIKAMLSLALKSVNRKRPVVLAARNAHKAFLYAAAWLDFDIVWLMPKERGAHLASSSVTEDTVSAALSELFKKENAPHVAAVYLTSPDYLGTTVDIAAIASVTKAYGIPLLVDNAHGAYLKFTDPNRHPISLGATMCCDSAHKTLPVLTGGAYLHIAKDAPIEYLENARMAMASFASTSPSYLILASLDLANRYLAEEFKEKYRALLPSVEAFRQTLLSLGFTLYGNEPLKVTVDAASVGTTGDFLAELLRKDGIECEFSDIRYLVMMLSTETTAAELARTAEVFSRAFNGKAYASAAFETLPEIVPLPVRMTPREALLARSEIISVEDAVGRVAASPTVACPPAIPIAVSGEEITENALRLFRFYGIKTVAVVK